ncbi:MAG: hypothetical protein ACTSRU_07170 [Candidatus Hodarchaeales archaeon]
MTVYEEKDLIGSRTKAERPSIGINWKRGWDRLDFKGSRHHLIVGLRDAGKSSLAEAIATRYPQIVDIFGSKDNEGLCWLRSGMDDILLVVDENCELECEWDVAKINELSFKKFNSYEVVITVPAFYQDIHRFYQALSKFTRLFEQRLSFNSSVLLVIREASNFIYSRVSSGESNKDAKNNFITFQREMRHFGYSIVLDTIRWTAIDKEMRDLADYVYFKDLGYQGLAKDVSFIYKHIRPTAFSGMAKDKFVILTRNSSIGRGQVAFPKFHKLAGEDLMKLFGLYPVFGAIAEESTSQRVGDKEHSEIIEAYVVDMRSMDSIATFKGRSKSTISSHIERHNVEILQRGYCPMCKRAESSLDKTVVDKDRR